MAETTTTRKTMQIKWMFWVGFLDDKGKNNTPDYFADNIENLIIKNGWITVRPWNELVYSAWAANPIRWMITNSTISETRVYYVANQHLRYIDLTDNTSHDIGSISTDNQCVLVNAWKYILIFTWASYPWYYDWTTLAQVTSSELDTNINPEFWGKFAWFVICNNKLNPNVMNVSRPITTTNPEYCYHFKWSDSQTIDLSSKFLGTVSTMNALWLFTATNIQVLTRDNLASTGWLTSLYTIPFASSYSGLASNRAVTAAWDAIFFLTPNKKIASVNYEWTVTTPRMKIISDKPWMSIDWFMQRELDDDQSSAFAFYDERYNHVKFRCKTRNSTVPDVVIIYDITNKTFIKFYDLLYWAIAKLENSNEVYAWWSLSHKITKDWEWTNDCWEPINWLFESTDIAPIGTWYVQTFVWTSFWWQTNSLLQANIDIYVDDTLAVGKKFLWTDRTWTALLWIGSHPIWWAPISWHEYKWVDLLVDFEADIGYESLRYTWKKIKFILSGGTIWEDFIFDKYSLTFVPRVRKLRTDKL